MKRRQIKRAPRRPPHAFQQQVVQHERHVERGIAEPRAFGVEDHRSVGPDQEVLRTEVAMDEDALVGLRGADELGEPAGEVRMGAAGRDEVGLQPDRVEDRVGREARGDLRPVRGRRVDASERVADRGCGGDVDRPVAQQRLPDRVALGRQPRHRERRPVRILADDRRHGGRDDGGQRSASTPPRSGCARPAPAIPRPP